MFVSRRKYAALQAQLTAATVDRDWFAEQANDLWEEAAYLRETNTQWADIYEYMQEREIELYAENERLRSWNYDLMGYEDDIEVPF